MCARALFLLCAIKTKVQPQQNSLPGTYQPARVAITGLAPYGRHDWESCWEKWLINGLDVVLHKEGVLGSTSAPLLCPDTKLQSCINPS